MIEQFYTVEEIAEILNLSTQTVLKLIKERRLLAIKIGRTYRIPYESIELLLKR